MVTSRSEQRRRVERARAARAAAQALEEFLATFDSEEDEGDDEVKLTLPTGEELLIPRRAAELLTELLEALGDGQEPSVLPKAMELSTGEVAALLGVSRQYVTRLLDEERIPSRRAGTHRRVLASDALRYRREDDRRRARRLRELAGWPPNSRSA